MSIIFNSYNTTSAGTANVTLFILKSLAERRLPYRIYFIVPGIPLFKSVQSRGRLKVIRIPALRGWLKYIFRGLYDIIVLPVSSLILNASAVIVLANYSPVKVWGKKIVFMRHPFLVDNYPETYEHPGSFSLEGFRRLIFILTLKTSDVIVVQSDSMRRALFRRYGKPRAKVHVLANPLSNLLDRGCRDTDKGKRNEDKIALYVSRYAPHKQHMFLLRLADRYAEELKKEKIKFYITVDPSMPDKGARGLLDEIRRRGLGEIICNLGELPNEDLSQYYKTAKCLFFPSASETFGNPLVEAMVFGLPVIVPDLDYARAVCAEAGVYYKADEIDDAFDKLINLMVNRSLWERFSQKSRLRSKRFPTTDRWIDEVLSLMAS